MVMKFMEDYTLFYPQTSNSACAIGDYLTNKATSLGRLAAQSSELQQLTQWLQQQLAEPLASKVRALTFKESTLVIGAESAEWATWLKFQLSPLLEKLRKTTLGAKVGALSVVVRADSATPMSKPANAEPELPLAEAPVALFQSMAKQVSDPKLAAALARFGQS